MSAPDRTSCIPRIRHVGDVMCPRGRYGDPKSLEDIDRECTQCPDGKYQPNEGAGSCYACDDGKRTIDDATMCLSKRAWFRATDKREKESRRARVLQHAADHLFDGLFGG